jgi:nucleotide-binding universal stress UspA family protein
MSDITATRRIRGFARAAAGSTVSAPAAAAPIAALRMNRRLVIDAELFFEDTIPFESKQTACQLATRPATPASEVVDRGGTLLEAPRSKRKGGDEMPLFEKILWPTDFSDPSYEALALSCELAEIHSAELLMVHVVSPIPVVNGEELPLTSSVVASPAEAAEYRQQMEQIASRSLKMLKARRVPASLHPQTVVTYGDAVERLLIIAREEQIELIVTATRGTSGIKRAFFGSVADRLVKQASCPVLVVPA